MPILDVSSLLPTAALPLEERLRRTLEFAKPLFKPELRHQIDALLSPTSLAILVTFTTAWAVSHFFGVGEVADAVMVATSGILMGASALQVGSKLFRFATLVYNGKTDRDFKEAAQCFVDAVVQGGIAAVLRVLFKWSPRVFRLPPDAPPVRIPVNSPKGPGLFYRPKVTTAALPTGILGKTNLYGDITLEESLSSSEAQSVLWHEQVHSFLSPKLYLLRRVRITLLAHGYARSYILRYLEEALAESYAQIRQFGLKGLPAGIRFPVANGYVTLSSMEREIQGILLGPVMVEGLGLQVYFQSTAQAEAKK